MDLQIPSSDEAKARELVKLCDSLVSVNSKRTVGFGALRAMDSDVRAFNDDGSRTSDLLSDVEPRAFANLIDDLSPSLNSYEEMKAHSKLMASLPTLGSKISRHDIR